MQDNSRPPRRPWLRRHLEHPLTQGLSLDDPATTQLRRRILREKPFLAHIYQEWYRRIALALPPGEGAVLELGSGPGFLQTYIPDLITSDVLSGPDVRVVLDGKALPFSEAALRAIVMTDVLHHLPQPRSFFAESARCVRSQGAMIMIEPWVTAWSSLVYSRLHHEPFCPQAAGWEFPEAGPLSGANGALPWMIFHRDRARFEREYPAWRVQTIEPFMPFRYLLSGGVSTRFSAPGWTFGAWQALEALLEPWMGTVAMFAQIKLLRAS